MVETAPNMQLNTRFIVVLFTAYSQPILTYLSYHLSYNNKKYKILKLENTGLFANKRKTILAIVKSYMLSLACDFYSKNCTT